jgi:ABC-type nitrate/sulfonate/bicarbonate transport system permease component
MEITRQTRFLLSTLSVVSVLLLWEATTRLGFVPEFLLPAVSTIVARFFSEMYSGELLSDVFGTLGRTFAGFGIAAVLGVSSGILIARVRMLRWLLDPLISLGLPTPKIAFLPMFILWFGVFNESKIAMTAFNAFFPIVVATCAGTEAVDEILVWSARGLGASGLEILWDIALPAARPAIVTGLQIAIPISLIVTIVSEMATSGDGLGGQMIRSARLVDSPGVFAGILATGLLGTLLMKSMEYARRHLLSWHAEGQA